MLGRCCAGPGFGVLTGAAAVAEGVAEEARAMEEAEARARTVAVAEAATARYEVSREMVAQLMNFVRKSEKFLDSGVSFWSKNFVHVQKTETS